MDRYHELLAKRDLMQARTIAAPEDLERARKELVDSLTEQGLGDEATEKLLFDTIVPALAPGHAGPRYFGFVTGGRTNISLIADHIVSNLDNNVQVHLPHPLLASETFIPFQPLLVSLAVLRHIPPPKLPFSSISYGSVSTEEKTANAPFFITSHPSYDEHFLLFDLYCYAAQNDSISTHIESLALDLVLDLLSIPRSTYPSKTITTGATASNILGLALGRQAVVSRIKSATYSSSSHQESSSSTTKHRDVHYSVAEDGFGGVEIDILCAGAHASIRKAASIVGIGRTKVVEVVKTFDNESNTADQDEKRDLVAFDLVELENRMKIARDQGRGNIVCPAYGEVNTGAFTPDMPVIRRLCDEYGAWLHLDAAFGGFGVLHPEFKDELQEGLALADSLTLDGHKWLNVPYDCGLFYTRSELVHQAVCGPGLQAPAYLSTSSSASSVIPSPLNVRLENSSRFRALPLYASLVCYGKEGYASIIRRNISFARSIEEWLRQNENYDVLTPAPSSRNNASFRILNIVLFAPSSTCPIKEMRDSENGGNEMTLRINKTGEMYVTATKWKGRSAARLAVSNHLTGTDEGDFQIVVRRLKEIMEISSTV